MDLGLFLGVFRRHWVTLLIGLVLALCVATLVAYKPTSAGFSPRFGQQYKSSIRLLVSTGDSQVFSSGAPQTGPNGGNQTPNFSTGDLADIYSQLIMSDTITSQVEKMYGHLANHKASITAFRVLAQSPNGFGVSRPRPLPLIEVDALADSPENAATLAQLTGDLFAQYIHDHEDAVAVPATQRITVSETNKAAPGALSSTSPLILFGLITVGLVLLVIVAISVRYNIKERPPPAALVIPPWAAMGGWAPELAPPAGPPALAPPRAGAGDLSRPIHRRDIP